MKEEEGKGGGVKEEEGNREGWGKGVQTSGTEWSILFTRELPMLRWQSFTV